MVKVYFLQYYSLQENGRYRFFPAFDYIKSHHYIFLCGYIIIGFVANVEIISGIPVGDPPRFYDFALGGQW